MMVVGATLHSLYYKVGVPKVTRDGKLELKKIITNPSRANGKQREPA